MSLKRACILIACTLLLASCASGPSGGGTLYQATLEPQLQDRTSFRNLLIAPINFGKPSRSYLVEHESHIDDTIARRLEDEGYHIMPPDLFENAWREAVRNWGDPYDETTGRLNETAFQYALGEVFRSLSSTTEVNAVVFTNLEELQVYFSPTGSHVTHFLGVSRKPSSRGGEGVSVDFDWVQAVDAVGLYIYVFDLNGKRLFNGAGGIEVTETLDLKPSTPRWVRQKKILDNDSYIDEGVELALHPWIPSKRLSR